MNRRAFTGRYVIVLDRGEQESGLHALRSTAGIGSVERVREADAANVAELLERPDVSVHFEALGVVVAEVRPDQRHALVTTAVREPSIVAAEPECMVYPMPVTAPRQAPAEFFPAYRGEGDVVQRDTMAHLAAAQGPAWDEEAWTWGLQAIRVNLSGLTGRDVSIAVLDTGVDTDHPDLAGRIEATASFVPQQTVEDGNGHGTACIGIAAGPASPRQGPRYGVASEARILVAKVLSDSGKGADGQILAGMEWAMARGARVISLSLGGLVQPGQLFPQAYESVARRAAESGAVVVAAAGDYSDRPLHIAPVSRPANCPAVLAVAALDASLSPAFYSNAGINGDGGEINIAAPGRDVRSAAPNGGYQVLSGTSMAAPHAAGVVVLLAQQYPDASAAGLKARLEAGAWPLPHLVTDVGPGLLQAP
ncbi:S8 family serine peptidase [Streptomyces cinnabarinus]|uniref:S8 family serine peptidase n=1 Tax=Streptomyces cinnabarinus TaxID=67287 RepID=A0ABY7KQ22_9ACTN|nr:S8 family serine peptidase [Streptomyces cinnabarinus]WAZ25765.1 S8 family serine peptidase [Streptomyces cinnabarinus]